MRPLSALTARRVLSALPTLPKVPALSMTLALTAPRAVAVRPACAAIRAVPAIRAPRAVSVVAAVLAITAPAFAAENWPNFRGPNHDGISKETGLKTDWVEPLPLVWERAIGSAFSSMAIVDGRLYTCGEQSDQQVIYCLDAADGQVVWQRPIEKAFKESHGDGTRSTPTVDDGRVYIFGAHGRLVCYGAADGDVIWERTYTDVPQWGYSGSVRIAGELALVGVGGSSQALTALNKKTGEPVWRTGSGPAGYSTPYVFEFDSQRYVAAFLGDRAIIADLETGQQYWDMEWKTSYEVNAATPIYHDGHLFFTSGYQQGSILLKLSGRGESLQAEPVWQGRVMLNRFQTPILHEGHLYGSDQRSLKCVEFLTGQEQWQVPRVANATLVLAQDHLFLLTERGELQIAPVSPQGWAPKTEAEILSGRCWTVPVLYDGKIYARNLERLVCFDLTPQR